MDKDYDTAYSMPDNECQFMFDCELDDHNRICDLRDMEKKINASQNNTTISQLNKLSNMYKISIVPMSTSIHPELKNDSPIVYLNSQFELVFGKCQSKHESSLHKKKSIHDVLAAIHAMCVVVQTTKYEYDGNLVLACVDYYRVSWYVQIYIYDKYVHSQDRNILIKDGGEYVVDIPLLKKMIFAALLRTDLSFDIIQSVKKRLFALIDV